MAIQLTANYDDAMTSECHEHDAMRVLLVAMKKEQGVYVKKHCLNVILDVQGHVHAFPVSFQNERSVGNPPSERFCCQMTGIWCDRCVTLARVLLALSNG